MSIRVEPVLAVRQLAVRHRVRRWLPFARRRWLRAVDGVNLDLRPGETVALVGESGAGKSTLARALLGLLPAAAGSIRFAGRELVGLDRKAWLPLRCELQMLFQDPRGNLDPGLRVSDIVAGPLQALHPQISPDERRQRAEQMVARVGLPAESLAWRAKKLSGGQCQRVAIARALACEPKLLICDEAVSALDPDARLEVLELLRDIQARSGLAILLITQDLGIVRRFSDRVVVMYFGRVMEQALTPILFETPRHPYTKALLASVAGADPGLRAQLLRAGPAPDLTLPLQGCLFTTRCPMADEQCPRRVPHMHSLRDGSAVACHYVADAWVPPTRAA